MKISEKAYEFENAFKALLVQYADKLNHGEAYQALSMVLARVLDALVTYLRRNGKSEQEIRDLFSNAVDLSILGDDEKPSLPH